MTAGAYYNEVDKYAAQWLRNLIDAGHIAPGDVDERSIVDVRADDLRGYTQCHFFAGVAGWSVALRLAGWDDTRSVWTGSCPCQPFSAAGAGKAGDDERHLWPAWASLIAECRPGTVFGEQVEAAVGWGWLDLVFSDLEAEGYACGSAVLPACAVSAPHIRNRLWFVADADELPSEHRIGEPGRAGSRERDAGADGWAAPEPRRLRDAGGLGDTDGAGSQGWCVDAGEHASECASRTTSASFWSDAEWLPCSDGKARPIEPGSFPLVDGLSFKLDSGSAFAGKSRAQLLRGFGNAIVPPVAAEFIRAAMEARAELAEV